VFSAWNPSQPEISDLIIQHDPATLERLPVRKDDVRSVFVKFGNRQAVRAIDALPERDGILDPTAIDRLFVVVHSEMQRLAEEFYHGGRVWELLQPVIAAIRASGVAKNDRLRVVDIGCGIGYTVRWLAACAPLAEQGIDLVGMDLNSTLIREATRLARAENLPCRFVHGDAFSPANSGHIYLSTGVLHHFRGDDLANFFRRHELPETQAFLYYDFQPSFLAGPGSWFFHVIRMRTALARHDGVLSALRVHSAQTLVDAARPASPGFASGMYGRKIWRTPLPRVFHTLIGLRRPLIPEFRRALGHRIGRLDELA
jgi:SAM-dependent methyltransferase